ncbi:protein kinase domain-containing protein [Streptomyces sp. NPDC003703]|uniref:protein kinase domain-containing protein n=1 Tax=Streptomyces sp. NPDC003283 TaxID=3364681 RepID=UPI0036A131F2
MAQSEELASVGAGRYKLIRAVGRGGMATVHQATDTALGRRVAVKVMDRVAAGEEFRTRFRQEARAMAALNHRNVIAIHDVGEEADPSGTPTPYLVMEFIDGRPLGEFVSGHGMPAHRALRITADILSALAASHDAGLIHRDIKPANIMISENDTVKVLDFGIAKAVDAVPVTRTGTVVGTAPYMSPEQAQGKKLDRRSDLYSTGVLLFELLSARRPFDADSDAALLYHHVHTAPPLLAELGIAVPEPVQELLSSALSKDPEGRPATARQMRRLVLDALNSADTAPPRNAPRPRIPARPAYAPAQPPPPLASTTPMAPPSPAIPGSLKTGLVAAVPGYFAGTIGFSQIFSAGLTPTATAVCAYTLGYGPMYLTVLFGLAVGTYHARTAARRTRRHSSAVACLVVNGLWSAYHLGTWLFGFPLLHL